MKDSTGQMINIGDTIVVVRGMGKGTRCTVRRFAPSLRIPNAVRCRVDDGHPAIDDLDQNAFSFGGWMESADIKLVKGTKC